LDVLLGLIGATHEKNYKDLNLKILKIIYLWDIID
jgi:hypothetical protein